MSPGHALENQLVIEALPVQVNEIGNAIRTCEQRIVFLGQDKATIQAVRIPVSDWRCRHSPSGEMARKILIFRKS